MVCHPLSCSTTGDPTRLRRAILAYLLGFAIGLLAVTLLSGPVSSPRPVVVRGPLCSVVHPRFDPGDHGPLVLSTRVVDKKDQACVRRVESEIHPKSGLGHKMTNAVCGVLMSLAWGSPVLVDRAQFAHSRHEDYKMVHLWLESGLGEPRLWDSRAFASESNLSLVKLRPQDKTSGWTTRELLRCQRGQLKCFLGTPTRLSRRDMTGECGAVFKFVSKSLWLSDLSLAMPFMMSMMSRSARMTDYVFDKKVKPDQLVIAAHLRYAVEQDVPGSAYKSTDKAWLSQILGTFRAICREQDPVQQKCAFMMISATGKSLLGMDGEILVGQELTGEQAFQHLVMADVLVCGRSSLCFIAALSKPEGTLAFIPPNAEPYPSDTCPGSIQCVPTSGELTVEQKIKFRSFLASRTLTSSQNCPRSWRTR